MKTEIDKMIYEQVNLILSLGKSEILPAEYLTFIVNNYEFINNVCSKQNEKNADISMVESLSILVSKIK